MADAVGGVAPYRRGADRRHHVDENAQRRRQIDAAAEQQPRFRQNSEVR
jgi:hypothetical protein